VAQKVVVVVSLRYSSCYFIISWPWEVQDPMGLRIGISDASTLLLLLFPAYILLSEEIYSGKSNKTIVYKYPTWKFYCIFHHNWDRLLFNNITKTKNTWDRNRKLYYMYSNDKDSSCNESEGRAFSSLTSNQNTRAYSNILTAVYLFSKVNIKGTYSWRQMVN
jgi:hypothetical protein